MNKFEEVYREIISEGNSFDQESQEVQNVFKDFIGKKYIIAHVIFDFSKNINENDFKITRAAIKDVKIEKSLTEWKINVIFDNNEYFFSDIHLYVKSKREATPEALTAKMNREFSGNVSYIGGYSDHWGNENEPESWYKAEDKGQTDDQIKNLFKVEVSKDIKKIQEQIRKQIYDLNNKVASFNKFLGDK